MKKIIILTALLASNVYADGDVSVLVTPTSGFRNQYLVVRSIHNVDITNTQSTAQSYDYSFKLCPYGETCVDINKHVILNPGQHYVDNQVLQQNAMYHNQGHFPAYATSGVKGDGINITKNATGDVTIN